jgi:ABC-type nitrate/sulfonate/bicarbonate transport system ATPase subunit
VALHLIQPQPQPQPTPPKLIIEGVSKRFFSKRATVEALENVWLTVLEGEFVCLLGPSGCGKSTLLDIMAGLTKPESGQVLADGQRVTGPGQQRLADPGVRLLMARDHVDEAVVRQIANRVRERIERSASREPAGAERERT